MALLRDYNRLGARKLHTFSKGVVTGCSSDPTFASLTDHLTELTTRNTNLEKYILPFPEQTSHSLNQMKLYKELVVQQLDLIRPLAEALCNGDKALEELTGFTSNKETRSRRTSIDPALIIAIDPAKTSGYLNIMIEATIPGNTGYEVHYILNGEDRIAGIGKVSGRSNQILMGGFPRLVEVDVYLITLSTNGVRSIPSNHFSATAL